MKVKLNYESPMVWNMKNARIPTRCQCACGSITGSGSGLM
jgi:hypothetical protein